MQRERRVVARLAQQTNTSTRWSAGSVSLLDAQTNGQGMIVALPLDGLMFSPRPFLRAPAEGPQGPMTNYVREPIVNRLRTTHRLFKATCSRAHHSSASILAERPCVGPDQLMTSYAPVSDRCPTSWRWRTGERISHKAVVSSPAAPTSSVTLRPTISPRAPPASAPRGRTP